MAAFDYRQAEELKHALGKQQVRYLFIGKSAAIILGFPDTTQDADLFIDRSPENGRRLAAALLDLGFELTSQEAEEIERPKDFVQLKNGPFDVVLVFAPDGIETFQEFLHFFGSPRAQESCAIPCHRMTLWPMSTPG